LGKSVLVTTAGGTNTANNLFNYDAPTISAIDPNTGSTAGGTIVTITGNNLRSATAITVGGNACTRPSANSDTSVACFTPEGSVGSASVVVTTASGNSAANALFTYTAPAPSLSAILPSSGSTAGGTSVTISGTNLSGATGVTIGGAACTTLSANTATSVTCLSPAGTGLNKAVVVTTATGPSTGSVSFSYGAPTISGISPNTGSTAGGTSVTISGSNLRSATAITIGGNACTSPSANSDTAVSCTTPAGAVGGASVVVSTASGSATANGIFTYTGQTQTVTFTPTSPVTVGVAPITLTATASSDLSAFTFSTSSANTICTVSGNTLTIVGAGTCALTATQAGNANYASASANANVVINAGEATCNNASNGQTLTSEPAANQLCTAGQASAVTSGNTSYTWSCSGGGTPTPCSAIRNYLVTPTPAVNGVFEPAGAQSVAFNAKPSFRLVPATGYGIGSASGCAGGLSGNIYTAGPISAHCSVTASFSANRVDGVCNPGINGQTLSSTPTNLCTSGVASLLNGDGPWRWTCTGSNGGSKADCSANISLHTVSTSAGSGGSISPGSRSVSHGGVTRLTVAAEPGYVIGSAIGCNGSLQGALYTTGEVTADCTVAVSFAATNTTTRITGISPSPSKVNQPVLVSFAVSNAGNSSDMVTISDGAGSALCSASVAAGSCSTSFTSSGSKMLIASYMPSGVAQASASAGSNHRVADVPALVTPSLPSGVVGIPYAAILVANGGIAPYSFDISALPTGFSLQPSGLLTGMASSPINTAVSATVTDSLGQTASRVYTLTMLAQLAVTTTSLPEGLVNTHYAQVLRAVGGKTPYRWELGSGALPAGLSMNASSGLLSGTLTELGTSASFEVVVQDANGQLDSQTLSVTTQQPSAVKGSGDRQVAANLNPSDDGNTCTLDDQHTLVLEIGDNGAPVSPPGNTTLPYGMFQFTVQGCTPGQTQLNVRLVYPAALPEGTRYWKYGKTADQPVNHWYMLPGAVISGNIISYSITDGGLGDDDMTADGSITDPGGPGVPALAIGGTPADGQVGSAYAAALSVSNGTGPYNWSITNGNLPAGVSLNAVSGLLGGTPTQAGNFNFTVQLVDTSNNASTTQPSAVTIADPAYTIAVSASPAAGGSASCTPNPVSAGSTSTCSASPSAGYSFAGWSGDCSGATCSLTNVQAAKSVTASFSAISQPSPASQTIRFAPASPVNLGAAPISLTATASSGLTAFTFSTSSASSICTVTGNTLTLTGVGTCTLTATQAGDASYASASASASVVINDSTPPLTTAGPTILSVGIGQASAVVTINENGIGYWLLLAANAAVPSVQTLSSQGSSVPMSANTPVVLGLLPSSPNTAYKLHFVAKDTAGNLQTMASSAAFTSAPDSNRIEGLRGSFHIVRSGSGFVVSDKTAAKPDRTFAADTPAIAFDDFSVNLLIGDLSKTIDETDLKTLIELYVAFFNRVPEADGLAYWITRYQAGMTIDQIADSFYVAAIQYSSLTGYTAGMSDTEFVGIIYKNVLWRSGATSPPAADVQYWVDEFTSARLGSRGKLVRAMLGSAHTFSGDATWGWVSQLLDNKLGVARVFAVQQGLNYNTPQQSITGGMAIAAQVTPESMAPALQLIGFTDAGFDLTAP